MKKSHLRHIKRVGILLCLLLILCSAEYLVGISNQGSSIELSLMASKALQEKLKSTNRAQRKMIRKKDL